MDSQQSHGDRIVKLETILPVLERNINEIRLSTKEIADAVTDLRYLRLELVNLRTDINKVDSRLGKRDDDYDLAMNRIITLEKQLAEQVTAITADLKSLDHYVKARWWALATIVAAVTAIVNIVVKVFF